MNPQELLSNIKLYLASLHLYDFLAYGWIFLVFIFFVILSIVLRHKAGLSVFFVLLSFCMLFVAPIFVKHLMDGYIRKGVIEVDDVVRFSYAKSLSATGKITNMGKKEFSKCVIDLNVIKVEDNMLLQIKNELQPLRHSKVEVLGPIKINESKPFKITISNFTTTNDYNTSIKARCY